MDCSGVHCHIDHIIGLVDMAAKKGLTEVYVHPITDGRDTAPESGVNYLAQLQEGLDKIGVGKIATVIGRYYGMDRDNNWDREKLAYDALTIGDGEVYPNNKDMNSWIYRCCFLVSQNTTTRYFFFFFLKKKGKKIHVG